MENNDVNLLQDCPTIKVAIAPFYENPYLDLSGCPKLKLVTEVKTELDITNATDNR